MNISKELKNKYQVLDNALKATPKDDWKDRIEFELGDSKQPDKFYPQFKLMRDKKGRFVKGNTPFDRTGIKHTKETKRKLRIARAGRKPALGMKHTEETKRKLSEARKREWELGLRTGHSHPISNEQKEFLSKIRRGKNNPAWIDGRSKITNQIRKCLRYRQWRSSVFERDNWTCVLCGKRGGYVEADHYPKEFAQIFSENKIKTLEQALECDEFWNTSNGRTLCKECHERTKKYANNRYK